MKPRNSAQLIADVPALARILMCRPDHYGIEYEINPWMHREKNSDRALAIKQWEDLVTLLESLGAEVELVPPMQGLPDMVFTANAGVVFRRIFVPAHFRYHQRQGEEARFIEWFVRHEFEIRRLPSDMFHEGAGDSLFCGDILYCAYIFRSEARAHQTLGQLLGVETLGLELVDPRFYHLDTCFCPLNHDTALCYLPAFDSYAQQVLRSTIANLIEVDEQSAVQFGCNAVVVGKHVVLNTGTDPLVRQVESAGFTPHQTALSEFLKAGGSSKCLTLRIDGEEAAGWKHG